jgi:hypothetical protein
MSHLVETASSNFLFGMLIGWLLMRRKGYQRLPVAQGAR